MTYLGNRITWKELEEAPSFHGFRRFMCHNCHTKMDIPILKIHLFFLAQFLVGMGHEGSLPEDSQDSAEGRDMSPRRLREKNIATETAPIFSWDSHLEMDISRYFYGAVSRKSGWRAGANWGHVFLSSDSEAPLKVNLPISVLNVSISDHQIKSPSSWVYPWFSA